MNSLKFAKLCSIALSLSDRNRIGRILRMPLFWLVLSLLLSGLLPAWAQTQKSGSGTGRPTTIYTIGGSTSNTSGSVNLQYYGGPVMSNVEVVVVYWGDNVSPVVTTGIPGFFSALVNSNYTDLLSEYSTNGVDPVGGGTPGNQSIGRGTLGGAYSITPSAANSGNTVDDTQIQAELLAQINAGHLPAPATDSNGLNTTLYMISVVSG